MRGAWRACGTRTVWDDGHTACLRHPPYGLLSGLRFEGFELQRYAPHPHIKAQVAAQHWQQPNKRLPEISGSLCVADKRGGLKAQAGADAEAVRAAAGRIEMDAGMVAGMGFVMLVAVVGAKGQRQIRGELFLRVHAQA